MRNNKIVLAVLLAFVMVVLLSACGGSQDTSLQDDGQQAATADNAGQAPEAEGQETQTANWTQAQEVVQQRAENIDSTASVENLIGKWTDVNFADRFVTISKTDAGYEYEDNEGKYPAAYKDGILKVEVAAGETADVYLDKASGHLVSDYQGNTSEFKK